MAAPSKSKQIHLLLWRFFLPLSQTILVCLTTELHPQYPASWPRRGAAGLLSSLIHVALLFVSVSGLLCAGVS